MSRLTQVVRAEVLGDLVFLHDARRSRDAAERVLAMSALVRLGDVDGADLDAAMEDSDSTVVLRAMELVLGSGHDAAERWRSRLITALTHDDDLVVEQSAWALGELEDDATETVAALARTGTEHPTAICREAAIAALGAIGHEDGLPTILAGLDDRPPVRRRAVLALAPFDGPDVEAALDRALEDRDRQVRQAAEDLR